MNDYYISKEKLKEYLKQGKVTYTYSQRDIDKPINFDLFILIENVGYRVATYSKKTEKVILTCPKWHIPKDEIIKNFVELAEKEERV